MDRPFYIPYSTFEDLADKQRQDFHRWNKSSEIALNALKYLDFLVEEQGLEGWQFIDFKKQKDTLGKDILGKYNVLDNIIWIEESLQKSPRRLAFTIAHEGEHFTKHRGLFENDIHNYYMFGGKEFGLVCYREDIAGRPSGDANRKQMEWQANYGAACLLLPLQELVKDIADKASSHDIATKYGVSYQAAEIRVEQINEQINEQMKKTANNTHITKSLTTNLIL